MDSDHFLNFIKSEHFLSKYWHQYAYFSQKSFALQEVFCPSKEDIFKVAAQRDVESRLIVRHHTGSFTLRRGPFTDKELSRLPEENWTILIQNANYYWSELQDLLWKFSFLPHARLDDLMISYSVKGGTVGAHIDSYDVFLLQAKGKKHWEISYQKEHMLDEEAPLKLLKNFYKEQEWDTCFGDVLYLPPQCAHYGVAIEEGMTYSIGFRAPTYKELAHMFLDYLADRIDQDCSFEEVGYEDRYLSLKEHPASISQEMLKKLCVMIDQTIRWDSYEVGAAFAAHASAPKNHIFFDRTTTIPLESFVVKAQHASLCLSPKTHILVFNESVFCNGEKILDTNQEFFLRWSMQRKMNVPSDSSRVLLEVLYQGFCAQWWYFLT
jgi:50S ribosomal protein L16 3-hydroxylase